VINKLPTHILQDTWGAITKEDVARVALVALNRFDKAAAVRYLSLHGRILRKTT
jgi:transcriptional regulator NrdR family protein